MYTQDIQPIDFSAWNSYADPKFVFYDRELVQKCQCADPVSYGGSGLLAIVYFSTLSSIEYMCLNATGHSACLGDVSMNLLLCKHMQKYQLMVISPWIAIKSPGNPRSSSFL